MEEDQFIEAATHFRLPGFAEGHFDTTNERVFERHKDRFVFKYKRKNRVRQLTAFLWFTNSLVKENVPVAIPGSDVQRNNILLRHRFVVQPSEIDERLKYLSNMLIISRITNKNPHFLKILGTYQQPTGGTLNIVMECAFSSFSLLQLTHQFKDEYIHPNWMHEVFRELLDAVSFLHEEGVTHEWISPEAIVCKCPRAFVPIALVDIGYYKHGYVDTDEPNHVPTEMLGDKPKVNYLPPELIFKTVFDNEEVLTEIQRKLSYDPRLVAEFDRLFPQEHRKLWKETYDNADYFELERNADVYHLARTMFTILTRTLPFLEEGKGETKVPEVLHTKRSGWSFCMSNCVGCLLNRYLIQRDCNDGLIAKWNRSHHKYFRYYGTHHAMIITMGLQFQPRNRPKISEFRDAYNRFSEGNEGLRQLKICCENPLQYCANYPLRVSTCSRLTQAQQYLWQVDATSVINSFGGSEGQIVPWQCFEDVEQNSTVENDPAIKLLMNWAYACTARHVGIPENLTCAVWNGEQLSTYQFDPFRNYASTDRTVSSDMAASAATSELTTFSEEAQRHSHGQVHFSEANPTLHQPPLARHPPPAFNPSRPPPAFNPSRPPPAFNPSRPPPAFTASQPPRQIRPQVCDFDTSQQLFNQRFQHPPQGIGAQPYPHFGPSIPPRMPVYSAPPSTMPNQFNQTLTLQQFPQRLPGPQQGQLNPGAYPFIQQQAAPPMPGFPPQYFPHHYQ